MSNFNLLISQFHTNHKLERFQLLQPPSGSDNDELDSMMEQGLSLSTITFEIGLIIHELRRKRNLERF